MGSLDGKVAVVSGASSGSGIGITRRFVAEGATVVMLARGKERLEDVASEFGAAAVPIACDIGDSSSVRDVFTGIADRFGHIHVLVNHAAVYRPCAVELLSDEDIERQVATNFLGPVYASRAAISLLRAAGAGDIINTSSESTLHPFPMLSMYVSTKAALEAFSRVLAQELRDDDIRVTTVVQGTAAGAGMDASDFSWDPEHAAAAHKIWTERGLLTEVIGRYRGTERRRHRQRARVHRHPAARAAARHDPRPKLLSPLTGSTSDWGYPAAATPTLWPWASAKTPKLVPGTCWVGWMIVPPSSSARFRVAATSSTPTKKRTSSSEP
jgi:NAD(P)-dependent dehydrogenase (short-subunit alcohol dehydrogenase family)